jgi:hypothetical protein
MTPPSRPPRVFIGLIEIAGYYSRLKRGFQALGVPATFVDIGGNPFAYGGSDRPNLLVRWFAESGRRFVHAPPRRPLKVFWGAVHALLRPPTAAWAIATHDVFVFGFGSSFFRHRELPLLRLLGKKTICVFNGSDARPPYLDRLFLASEEFAAGPCIVRARCIRRMLRRVDRHAHAVIDNPASGHLHGRPFVSWLQVGIPCEAPAEVPGAPPRERVRILHAPSHTGVKGTAAIRETIARLTEKGLPIDYVEISGRPHAEVQRELAACDFVVDQLYSDTPLAGFAAEAAMHGKPAVVGGYYAERVALEVPAEAIPPSLFCHPDGVEAAIERLVRDPAERRALGEAAREYVARRWTPRAVAERYLALIAGPLPPEWLFDPAGIRYLHGCGLSERRARASVRQVVDAGGVTALQLHDKPELEAMFVRFAAEEA